MMNDAETTENTIKVTEDNERVFQKYDIRARDVYTVEAGPSKHYVIVAMVT
jgi:hypothetical protein